MKVKRTTQPNRKLLIVVALSLLAVSVALLTSNLTHPELREYLVAARDLPTGAQPSANDFNKVALNLGSVGSQYLQQLPTAGQLTSALRRGQLLAGSGVGHVEPLHSVVIEPSLPLGQAVAVGTLVDVWFVAKTTSGFEPVAPLRVASGLEVRWVFRAAEDNGFSTSRVELAAAESDLEALMLACANEGFISVVAKS